MPIYKAKAAFSLSGTYATEAEGATIEQFDATTINSRSSYETRAVLNNIGTTLNDTSLTGIATQIADLSTITITSSNVDPGTIAQVIWETMLEYAKPNVLTAVTVQQPASGAWSSYVADLKLDQMTSPAQGTPTLVANDTLYIPIQLSTSVASGGQSHSVLNSGATVYIKIIILE